MNARMLIPGVALLIALLYFFNRTYHVYDRIFRPDRFFFVTVRGTEFYYRGEPFRFIGANTRLVHGDRERSLVAKALQNAKAAGVRVIRQWAVGECENDSVAAHTPISKYYFQAGPTNWNDAAFAQFDKILVEAAEQDLRVMITLFNNWSDYGGMPMYAYWAGLQESPLSYAAHDSFYTNRQIKTWARAFVEKMVTRRNTITGKLYIDDPAIFSWELVNEAQARLDRHPEMLAWTKEMAAYIKQLDPHHLVGTSLIMADNRRDRRHMIDIFSLPELDYVDVHLYPSGIWWRNFMIDDTAFAQLIDDYTQIAHHVVHKPLLIGEVGFKRGETWLGRSRAANFASLFEHCYHNGAAGVMVWSYSDPEWDDAFAINWREPEHAPVCSVMAHYGKIFAQNRMRRKPNPNVDAVFGSTFRVHLREQAFARDTLRPAVVGNDTLLYEISPQHYTRARWTNFGYWDRETGFAAVYGKDAGYFVYTLQSDHADTVQAAELTARLSSEFPPIPGADSLGRTDATISLNGVDLAALCVRPQRYFGTIHRVALRRDHGRPLLVLNAGSNVLRFEVKPDALHQNGLAILGAATSEDYQKEEIPILLEIVSRKAVREKPRNK